MEKGIIIANGLHSAYYVTDMILSVCICMCVHLFYVPMYVCICPFSSHSNLMK